MHSNTTHSSENRGYTDFNVDSLRRYVLKKGVGYFLCSPTDEDVKTFKGILFDNYGLPNITYIYQLAGASGY